MLTTPGGQQDTNYSYPVRRMTFEDRRASATQRAGDSAEEDGVVAECARGDLGAQRCHPVQGFAYRREQQVCVVADAAAEDDQVRVEDSGDRCDHQGQPLALVGHRLSRLRASRSGRPRKHGLNPITVVRDLFNDNLWLPPAHA
jgi:hypothetical protein